MLSELLAQIMEVVRPIYMFNIYKDAVSSDRDRFLGGISPKLRAGPPRICRPLGLTKFSMSRPLRCSSLNMAKSGEVLA